jgi:hypothetical protein
MKRSMLGALLMLSAGALSACGDDDEEGALPGATACDKWQSLSLRDTCDFPQDCDIDPACEQSAIAWMECAAKDLAQCQCEMDLQLNCAGSYLPNEGPALCGSEHMTFNNCVMAHQ